jgi:putative CocE/NonD family hydrolase
MYENYATLMTAFNFSPPHPQVCGEKWSEIWQKHLDNNLPWGIGFISHLKDCPYWRERSLRGHYERIQCPIFVIEGWADWYHTPLLRVFQNVKVPKRALIGPWSHLWPQHAVPGPRIDGDRECLKWFDQWLKGIDTGVLDEPPVTLFVREFVRPSTIIMEDKGSFRSESEWPIARRVETPMYLLAGQALNTEPGKADGADSYDYRAAAVGAAAGMHGGGPFAPSWVMPLDQRADEAFSLTYTTDKLEQDAEVTGLPRAILHVSSTADIAMFVVKLCDVAPDGTSALVTKGYLNATHRESHSQPSYLEPGEVYELDIELLACAYRFKAGHRIRVDIASGDFQNVWPTPKNCVNTVYWGEKRPSRVVLPIIPRQSPELPAPDLKSGPHPLPKREDLSAPDYSVSQDIINETATVRFKARFGGGANTAKFTVSSKNPARATVEADAKMEYEQFGKKIAVDAQCITESDERAFHHIVDLEIRVNGARHFNKSWSVSVPREFA